jgi:hypothetical protein
MSEGPKLAPPQFFFLHDLVLAGAGGGGQWVDGGCLGLSEAGRRWRLVGANEDLGLHLATLMPSAAS